MKTDNVDTKPVETPKATGSKKRKRLKPNGSRSTLNEAENAPSREHKRQKLLVKDPDGKEKDISIVSHQTVTLNAGLFSSILSATIKRESGEQVAIRQARILTDTIRNVVHEANTTRSLATQFANLTLRLLEEGDYDQDFKRMVYTKFYQSSRSTRGKFAQASGSSGSAAMKTWIWFLNMATEYQNRSVIKNKNGQVAYNANDRPELSRKGEIHNPNALIAFPNDTSIKRLAQLTDDNRPLGNLMLLARRIWYEAYINRWSKVPELMHMAQVLDSNFRTACTHNFIKRYVHMLRGRLATEAGAPLGWPPTEDLLQWMNKTESNRRCESKETIQKAFPTIEESAAKQIVKFLKRLLVKQLLHGNIS